MGATTGGTTVRVPQYPEFERELAALLNHHGFDAASSTHDFVLAAMLTDQLEAYRKARVWEAEVSR